MSSTMTMTMTSTRTRMHRSLSLAAPRGPSFASLPTELLLDILERALISSAQTARACALICKHISHLFDQILYRTVVLSTAREIELFARTVATKAPSFMPTHVKRLAITWDGPVGTQCKAQFASIMNACTGLRSVSLPEDLVASTLEPCPPAHVRAHDFSPMPSTITIGSFPDMSPVFPLSLYNSKQPANPTSMSHSPALYAGVSRLRIAQPRQVWQAPREALAALGPLALLTHLHFGRIMGANEENDIEFVADLVRILHARPSLKVLAVSVFPPLLAYLPDEHEMDDGDAEDRRCRASHIWGLLEELAKADRRLVVLRGSYDAWMREWDGVEVVANASGPDDFWAGLSGSRKSAA